MSLGFLCWFQHMYRVAGNFRGRKSSRNAKTWHRYWHAQILRRKLAGGSKTSKFVNVFSLESFPLYSIVWILLCSKVLATFADHHCLLHFLTSSRRTKEAAMASFQEKIVCRTSDNSYNCWSGIHVQDHDVYYVIACNHILHSCGYSASLECMACNCTMATARLW